MKFNDQIRQISFPDVSPFRFGNELDQFSMTAGDFLEIYNEKNEWNSVVTCYFIDTAHNIVDYIEKIWKILKPGGYWINFGPLLYHFSDMLNEKSIELSYEQIKRVIQNVGFKFVVNTSIINLFKLKIKLLLIMNRKKKLINHLLIWIINHLCLNILMNVCFLLFKNRQIKNII